MSTLSDSDNVAVPSASTTSQLQTLRTRFNSLVDEYQTTYKEFVANVHSVDDRNVIASKLKKINQQLTDINEEIKNEMGDSYTLYQTNVALVKDQNDILDQNTDVLNQEKEEISKMTTEFQTLLSAQQNTDLVVTMHYYNYVFLAVIAILLMFLLVKFSLSSKSVSEQVGGGCAKVSQLWSNWMR